MKTEKEKMLAGEMYTPGSEELTRDYVRGKSITEQFNASTDSDERKRLVKELFGTTGENITVQPHLTVDYGMHIHVGEDFFANYNCVFLDVCPIKIGKNAMLGPSVHLLTPEHPLDPTEKNSGKEYGKPITIGDNCWIGGNATIIGGVTLGDNVVVGAGAVVTKSFGDNVVLGGAPAKVIKEIPKK